jgi:hypothetical protein
MLVRYDIAKILLKLALNTKQSINQSINQFNVCYSDLMNQQMFENNTFPSQSW